MKSTSVSTAMKKDEFDRIWDETLQPLVKSYQKQFHLKVKNTNCLYYRMRKYFNKQRDLFLKSFMENDVYDIDRHKIASCYMKTVLAKRPLYIPLSVKLKFAFTNKTLATLLDVKTKAKGKAKGIDNKIYYANEYLALSVAVNIIDAYIMADDNKDFKHSIIIPEPFPEYDTDYLLDVCIDLRTNPLRKINIVSFANVFFLLEKYSCRRIQCEILENYLIGDLKKDKDEVKDIKFGKKSPTDET